jgi:RNA polymerase sigma factor (sigma-70 family)
VKGKPLFDAVVADHGATVLRVCRAMLNPVDADDAWSETFLSALRAYPDLPPGANLQAWLVTIAHRKTLDAIRAAGRSAIPMAELPDAPTGRRADERDLDLTAALAALPERQRLAVVYHYLGELPYRDVAAVIGGTAVAARRAAADGIATLRKTRPRLATTRVRPEKSCARPESTWPGLETARKGADTAHQAATTAGRGEAS